MPSSSLRAIVVAAAALLVAAPSAFAHPGHHGHGGFPGAAALFAVPFPAAGPSAGGYSSPNVEFVRNFPQHTDSAGGRKLGDYFYITTERDLTIYDVREPQEPVQVGHLVLPEFGQPVFTEEDPDTNGEILLISNGGVLMVIDVSDKTNPNVVSTLEDADDHTVSCVLNCTWAYGSEGTIVDLRDPANPVLSENSWQTGDIESEHDVTEVSPGIVLTSTQPLKLLDARDDPENPEVLASTPKEPGRFVHANLWPRGGEDDFLLVGGEAIGPGCSEHVSASLSTWDARQWRRHGTVEQIDEFRLGPGLVTEGRAPDSTFCVHWFDGHPYYENGGLVAIAWYEHGTHFLKVAGDGTISEVGWFLGGGGQASAAYWIDERTVYVADYIRGLDVLRFTGDIGTPPSTPTGGNGRREEPPGAGQQQQGAPDGRPPQQAAGPPVAGSSGSGCVPAGGLRSASVWPRGGGLRLDFALRGAGGAVDVDVFRQSAGRRLGDQLVARFAGRRDGVAWNGRANRPGRTVGDGFYVVRYRARTASGTDTRRIALRRTGGRWSLRPPFERRAACDLVPSFRLERPVFGGASNRGLGIAYRVARSARVTVTVLRGSRVVRRFAARTADAGRTHRLRLSAAGRPRGDYRVRLDARRGAERVRATALSRRL